MGNGDLGLVRHIMTGTVSTVSRSLRIYVERLDRLVRCRPLWM